MKKLALLILCIVCFSGCISKEEVITEDLILEQSNQQTPAWINYEFIESKTYFYFISDFKTQFHTPNFSYRRLRRSLYAYIENDIAYILYPLKPHMKKSDLKKMKVAFLEYVTQEVVLEIRKQRQIFWQKLIASSKGDNKFEYRYFVLIRLNKKKLRLYERKFIATEIARARYRYQSLIKKQLKYCYENVIQLSEIDTIKSPFLIDTIDVLVRDEDGGEEVRPGSSDDNDKL